MLRALTITLPRGRGDSYAFSLWERVGVRVNGT